MNSCSLLVPCHNAAVYLPRLWKTIEAQTIPFDEVIFYDDGSTDNTAEVGQALGATVLRGEQCRGAAFARNQLAKATWCSWFHFHDADDLLKPNYLEQVKCRITDKIDVVLCNVDWVDEETGQLLIPFRYHEQELNKNPVNYTLSHPIGGINGLYRREKFLDVGGFDESLRVWEDSDLHVRLAASGANITVVEEVLCVSLRHSNTVSNNLVLNWTCRFQTLKNYAQKLSTASKLEIATQAEVVANELLRVGDKKTAKEVIAFCQALGRYPPTTHNIALRLLKPFMSAVLLLQFQQFLRSSQILNLSRKVT